MTHNLSRLIKFKERDYFQARPIYEKAHFLLTVFNKIFD